MGARTKGCRTCKSRHVKCTLEQPTCKRCRDLDLHCTGYPSFHFIDENLRLNRKKAVVQAQYRELRSVQHPQKPPGPIPGRGISLIVFQDEILVSFLISKLVQGRSHCRKLVLGSRQGPPLILPCGPRGSWISHAVAESQYATKALAAIFFGQAFHLPEILTSALKLYGLALTEMRNEVQDTSALQNGKLVLSMATMCMFELANRGTDASWLKHADGLERVLKLQGPRPMEISDLTLFQEQRVMLISSAIYQKKRTILSHPSWKSIPWQGVGEKSHYDVLLDLFCDVAGLLAEATELHLSSKVNEPSNSRLRCKVMKSLHDMDHWWIGWMKYNPEACYKVNTDLKATLTADATGPLYPTVLRYSSLWAGYMVCTYDCMRILLLFILQQIPLPPQELCVYSQGLLADPFNESPLLGISSDIQGLAREVLQSFDYCYEQSGGFMGTFCIVCIFDQVAQSLNWSQREIEWLSSVKRES